MPPDLIPNDLEYFGRIAVSIGGISVRKQFANVAETSSPQQRIGNGMQKHVGIAVSQKALRMLYPHPYKQNEGAFHKPMRVMSKTNA
jgi:hypothetical protein